MSLNFHKTITHWYLQNKRDLPWRKTNDSYHIWLSEIILQQTRVAQGLPYYFKFILKFPTVKDLAKAQEEDILKLWQGLGYYSRARNLHAAAKTVINEYNGIFPKTYKELIKLKGVGEYTAAAIASFTNNEAIAVVDGNVYRVLSRIFGIETPINSTEGKKEFKKLANQLISKNDPATHNQAIMEFGALACTPKKPNCMYCPFNSNCIAYNTNKVLELPIKIKKTTIKKRYFNFYIATQEDSVLIEKREKKDIWQHLYQFLLTENNKELSNEEAYEAFKKFNLNFSEVKKIHSTNKPHKLSHQHIFASFFVVKIKEPKNTPYINVKFDELKKYPVPVLISNFIESKIFKDSLFL